MKLSPAFQQPGANKTPGPGTYDGKYRTQRSADPAWRIGTSKRDDQERIARRTQNFPPPDTYQPNYKAAIAKGPNWVFGTSKRSGLTVGKSVAPSMQSYTIPSRAVEGNKWSLGLKLDNRGALAQNKSVIVPGAGTYEPNYRAEAKKDPSFSIKGRYREPKKLDVPGPGTYAGNLSDKKAAPSYGFGSSPQREPIKKTLSPGPGGYRIPATIGNLPAYAGGNQNTNFKYI